MLQTHSDPAPAPAPPIISPEPSPVYAARTTSGPPSSAFSGHTSGPPSSAFSGRSSGPPSNAFAGQRSTAFSKNTPDRWNQYERDEEKLRQDSDLATGNAVLSAAEKAADRLASLHDLSSLEHGGASLPHPEEIKTSRPSSGGKFSFSSNRRSTRASEEEIVYGTHDRVRAEAMKVLEMADAPLRKTATGGYTTEPEPKKRVPSKLSGLSSFSSGNRNSQSSRASQGSDQDRRWTIDDMDDDDEDEMVDVVPAQTSPMTNDSSEKSAWSSRYSVNQSLMELTTGGYSDTKQVLDSMDQKEQKRMDKSARNMFRTSPHQAKQSPKVFGTGFAFKAKNVFGKKETVNPKNVNLKTVWMDVDLQSNGRSLPSPQSSRSKHRGPQTIESRRRRRRICIGVTLSVVLVVIIATVVGVKAPRENNVIAATVIDPDDVKFYVTADVPYDAGQEDKIIRDLETIPGDADFVVHLGNIQDASVTLCPQSSYISARAILRASPVPLFALPGPNDWNNCPNPSVSLADWNANLGYFERNFVHSFGVTHQLDNEANFGFLTKNVLFIGLHLVGGRKHDKEAWRVRHAKNVRWVEEQIATVPQDKYRALVFLANARPTQQHDDFFAEIFSDVNSIGKPVLYIHANAGSGKFEQYQPFDEASNLIAVQVPSGGSNPPMRVAVGKGDTPFVFSA